MIALWWAVGCALDVDFSLFDRLNCAATTLGEPARIEPDPATFSSVPAGVVFPGNPGVQRVLADLERGSLEVVVSPSLYFPVINYEPDDPRESGTLLISIEPTEDSIVIATRCPDDDCADVTFVVELPGSIDLLEARTDEGDLLVEGAVSVVNLEAAGDVTVAGETRELRAFTGVGDIRLDVADATTVDAAAGGLAELRGSVMDAVCARAVDRLEVELARAATVALEGGDDVDLVLDAPTDIAVQAAGDARLVVPAGRYALVTSMGSLNTLTVDPAIEVDPSADHAISVTTLDGDVTLSPREETP